MSKRKGLAAAIAIAHNLKETDVPALEEKLRANLGKKLKELEEKAPEDGNTQEDVEFEIRDMSITSGRILDWLESHNMGEKRKRKSLDKSSPNKKIKGETVVTIPAGTSTTAAITPAAVTSLSLLDPFDPIEYTNWILDRVETFDEKVFEGGKALLGRFCASMIRGAYPQTFQKILPELEEDTEEYLACEYLSKMWPHIGHHFSTTFLKGAIEMADRQFTNNGKEVVESFCQKLKELPFFPGTDILPFLAQVLGCGMEIGDDGVVAESFFAGLEKKGVSQDKSRESKGLVVTASKVFEHNHELATEENIAMLRPAAVNWSEEEWIFYPVVRRME